jgi:hypothetical protein
MMTSKDVRGALDRITDADELAIWLLRAIREAVAPLADMTEAELVRVAEGARPPPHRGWLTAPLAKLQLRLRAILAEEAAR